ncbi:MAG: hypothetical protein ACFFA7_16480 [Promethearchaeota archaeon]
MERNYKAILIIIYIIFVFSIISIPTLVIFSEFAHFSKINKSLTYKYRTEAPPINKELNLVTDVGIIDIKYVPPSVDYLVKIDVDIEMAGPNLRSKSYLDFFSIGWENLTSPLNFTMVLIFDKLVEFSNLHIANIKINIQLRADIVFSINAFVSEGAINFSALGITVSNLLLNVINGDIIYEFINCEVGGNISGTVNDGNATLITKNNKYTHNSLLTLKNKVGYILFEIIQYSEMGANITGMGITKTGNITVIYKDFSPDIGARFVFYNATSHGHEPENSWDGFDRDIIPPDIGQYYNSTDYPTQNNYNFSFFKWDGGNYLWDLYSIPT